MKKFSLWFLAFLITICAAYYQRKTGPTYPKSILVAVNDTIYEVQLIRSLGLDERPEVKLKIADTTIRAKLYYKRFKTDEDYKVSEFRYKVYPIDSYIMNKVFKIKEERGLFAEVPKQPPAGKLQYFIGITDANGTCFILKESPVIIRFKGAVPSYILAPHVVFIFLAMLFSTYAGLLSLKKNPLFRKYSIWTLILLILGGMILGPIVQKFAFGEYWTGIPFGWDLTDNKTLVALIFWILAVVMNHTKERPYYTTLAALVLLLVFSIPHSLFGSELDYASGEVTQGLIGIFTLKILKNY